MALVSTPAVLLRSYAFGESSRILRFFTRDLGPVGVVARGAGRKRRGGSPFTAFVRGTLTVYVKAGRDLHNLKEFNPTGVGHGTGSSALHLGGAGLVSELVLEHCAEEANTVLFEALERALDRVAAADERAVVPTALSEGWRLVSLMGYAPVVDGCVRCGGELGGEMGWFDFELGGVRCAACGSAASGRRVGPRARAQLHSLMQGEVPKDLARSGAHLRLFGDFVTYHVSGSRPLDSVGYLSRLMEPDNA